MWAPLLDGLAPNLPGHGGVPAPSPGTGFIQVVDALAQLLNEPQGIAGYSMGARLGLWLAARHPDKVRWLVLDGASLGHETEEARAERRAADETWCALLREQGTGEFLKAWDAQPLFGGEAGARGSVSAEGLIGALRCLGKGAMPYLGKELGAVRCPVLLVNGAHDTKGLAEAERVAAELPQARRAVLPGHHAVHAQAPNAWRARVSAFLNNLEDNT
jgi:2-succinyl-6-hydroxy-2,4-cyclohexadiene-1-carboxylate synthase